MFQEVSGLTVDLDSEEIVEGGENRFVHRLPKRTKYGELTLKRGLVTDSEVFKWCTNAIENFVFKPVDVNVSLLNEEHQSLVSWEVINAVPRQWSVSDFNANENTLVMETLKLDYQYFRILKQ